MGRLRGDRQLRIDYRHVIWSPCASRARLRYRFREDLFPTLTFRRAYDALRQWRGERADIEYVRILHLAASTMECDVETAIAALLEKRSAFDYAAVKALASPESSKERSLGVPEAPAELVALRLRCRSSAPTTRTPAAGGMVARSGGI